MVIDLEQSSVVICRMSAELRRCGWYVVVGAILLQITAVGLARMNVGPRNPMEAALVGGVLVLAGLGLVVAIQSWRLRIDSHGMSRRRMWHWDYWPWQEFRDGKITRAGWRLIARDHRWWCRSLLLELIEYHERELVFTLWKQFAPQFALKADLDNLPSELSIRFGLRHLTFSASGLRFSKDSLASEIPWAEVRELRIILVEHGLLEIQKVEIVLDDRTETLMAVRTIQTPDKTETVTDQPRVPAIVAAYLQAHVSNESLRIYAIKGEPKSKDEYDYWLTPTEKQIRLISRLQWILPIIMLVAGAIVFFPKLLGGWRNPGFMPNQGWLIVTTIICVLTISAYPILVWVALQAARKSHDEKMRCLQLWQSRQSQ